jgi:hypothetical protein
MFDSEEQRHCEALIFLHRQRLRNLEMQAARYGPLQVPSHIQQDIEDTQKEIQRIEDICVLFSLSSQDATKNRIVNEEYYPGLLNKYKITIVMEIVEARLYIIQCNYCEGSGKRPYIITDWKIMEWGGMVCSICNGRGVIKVQVDDFLIPDAYCEGSGKGKPKARARYINVCKECKGLGVRSVTGNIKIIT